MFQFVTRADIGQFFMQIYMQQNAVRFDCFNTDCYRIFAVMAMI